MSTTVKYPATAKGKYEFKVEETEKGTRWRSQRKETTLQAIGVLLFFTFPFVIMLVVLPSIHPSYLKIDCSRTKCTYQRLGLGILDIFQPINLNVPIDKMGQPRVSEDILEDGDTFTVWYATFEGKEYKIKGGDAAEAPGEAMVEFIAGSDKNNSTFYYHEFNFLFLMAQLLSWVPLLVLFFIAYLEIRKRPRSTLEAVFSEQQIQVCEYDFWGKRLSQRTLNHDQLKPIDFACTEGKDGPEFQAFARPKQNGPALSLTPTLHFSNFGKDADTGQTRFKQIIRDIQA